MNVNFPDCSGTISLVNIPGLEICGILVANATMFCHLLPGFSCGSKHLLSTAINSWYC